MQAPQRTQAWRAWLMTLLSNGSKAAIFLGQERAATAGGAA
jgi:hypothetical protein